MQKVMVKASTTINMTAKEAFNRFVAFRALYEKQFEGRKNIPLDEMLEFICAHTDHEHDGGIVEGDDIFLGFTSTKKKTFACRINLKNNTIECI